VHPVARWLWLMQDLPGGAARATSRPSAAGALDLSVTSETTSAGRVTIRVVVRGTGSHRLELRGENLVVRQPQAVVNLGNGGSGNAAFEGTLRDPHAPWVAVIVADGDVGQRQDAYGALPRYSRKEPVR
jgi:hypothetical protein